MWWWLRFILIMSALARSNRQANRAASVVEKEVRDAQALTGSKLFPPRLHQDDVGLAGESSDPYHYYRQDKK